MAMSNARRRARLPMEGNGAKAVPATILMASDRYGCQRLKDLLNMEDATTTMVVVMPSTNKDEQDAVAQPPTAAGPQQPITLHPRLLMAARNGDYKALHDLLNQYEVRPRPHHIIHMHEGAPPPSAHVVEEGQEDHQLASGRITQFSAVPPRPTTEVSVEDGADGQRAKCTEGALAAPQASAADVEEDSANVHHENVSKLITGFVPLAPGGSILDGVTSYDGDSALHVVAACGDTEDYLKCARMIYDKASYLLDAINRGMDTPLHCAARAGNIAMVSCLIELAAGDQQYYYPGAGWRVKDLLRKMNKHGETVLHGAIRSGSKMLVEKLLSEDPELVCVRPLNGTSPLYLAIALRRWDIAFESELLVASFNKFSYSGLRGRNVFHIAVLWERGLEKLLEICRRENLPFLPLIEQGDQNGVTPVHMAAAVDNLNLSFSSMVVAFMVKHLGPSWCILHHMTREGPVKLLIELNESLLYQPDKMGSYPIHVAAKSSPHEMKAVIIMLEKYPSCATLRDSKGSTFLHIAVSAGNWALVGFACRSPQFASVLNMQDADGNTALHLAVYHRDQLVFNYLFQNRQVRLDLTNKDGLTVLGLAFHNMQARRMFFFGANPQAIILGALQIADAPGTTSDPPLHDHADGPDSPDPSDRIDKRKIHELMISEEDKISLNITTGTQVIGIVSVLVAAVAFAAAFALPGGYRADDHPNGGTPTLAGSYAFDAFVISIALAFICSLLATSGLIYCGIPMVEFSIRFKYFNASMHLLRSSVRSLSVAFALGVYLAMFPVASKVAITVCVIVSSGLLYGNVELRQSIMVAKTVCIRIGPKAALQLNSKTLALFYPIFVCLFYNFWSFVLIFGLPAIWKIHRRPTKQILEWKKGLAKQADKYGRTPLHFAVSMNRVLPSSGKVKCVLLQETLYIVKLLLQTDESCAYRPDDKGSYPIHVAAALGRIVGFFTVKLMIKLCPDTASLRDNNGRTFLHVAVNNRCKTVVALTHHSPGLLHHVMNMQDKDGNTALHGDGAVHVCDMMVFSLLFVNRRVQLNLKNNNGQTPLDLAGLKRRLDGQIYPVNPQCFIYWSLVSASAPFGDNPDDILKQNRIQKKERKELSLIYKEAAQNFSIGAVLIVTVTFAATFTMPGGYASSDDKDKRVPGTPVLASTYFFDAFVVANALAFTLSGMATFNLMYAGYEPINFAFREWCTRLAIRFLHASVRSVGAAFVMGTYITLAPVAPRVVAAISVIAAVGLLYIYSEVWMFAWMTFALLIRGEIFPAVRAGLVTVGAVLWFSWPFAIYHRARFLQDITIDGSESGTLTLAGRYIFNAFILDNTNSIHSLRLSNHQPRLGDELGCSHSLAPVRYTSEIFAVLSDRATIGSQLVVGALPSGSVDGSSSLFYDDGCPLNGALFAAAVYFRMGNQTLLLIARVLLGQTLLIFWPCVIIFGWQQFRPNMDANNDQTG
uniref:PGG domain-containing protein n=1 Tax=Oryza punctata TaxID=4537 RepID=A0A0E0LZZ2_ORYPU